MKQTRLSRSGASQNYFKHMKRILLALSFVGILATCLAGFAQTNSPAGDAAATQDATNNAAQPAAPAIEASAPAPDTANTVSTAQPGPVIPLIVMDDVPLTDAIRNLARQA